MEKILQINGDKDLLNSMPKSLVKGRIFRNAKTIPD